MRLPQPGWTFQTVRPSRQYQAVVEQIRNAIFAGELKPGDRLPPERELCQMLGVSRVAVREALRVLQHSGLIEVRPGAGGGAFICNEASEPVHQAFLTQLRLDVFGHADLFEAKVALEAAIVAVAARKATAADLQALRDNIAAMRTADAAAMSALSYEFNQLLGQATHNNFLVQMMTTMADLLRHIGFPEIPDAVWQMVIEQHEDIVAAIAAGDAALATRLTEEHVESVRPYHVR